ncbi:MAG: hypothetical protein K2H91_11690 [Lachnospiraceae bacterium]|nr:hypothetical protein [Lachnospiraceae bacterium]
MDNLIIVAPKTHNEIHAEIDAQKKEQYKALDSKTKGVMVYLKKCPEKN